MTELFAGLTQWITHHNEWLGVAIFVVAFLECLALAGLVVPGTVVLFAISIAAGSGAMNLLDTLLLGFLGGILGDAVSYFLGRHFHERIRRLPGLRTHPEWISRAEDFIHKYGVASLLVGRFIGPLRPLLPLIAGMLDMPLVKFAAVSLVAAAGWSIAALGPGWVAGAALRLPLPEGFWYQAGVVAGGIVLLASVIAHGAWRERAGTTLLSGALCLAGLLALLFGWHHLRAFDEGLMALVQAHRENWLNLVAVVVTRMGDFRTQLIVAAVLTLVLAGFRQWRPLLFAVGTTLGTALANGQLKNLLARARPDVLAEPLTTYSLPSGHSSASFAFFLTLGILVGRRYGPRGRLAWLVIAALPAVLIALSRVYLGVHWPTDVLAGALLAGGFCGLSLALLQKTGGNRLEPIPTRTWLVLLPLILLIFVFAAGWALPEAVERYTPRL